MSNPIYPEIVRGLKVRHRETLEESTVKAVSNDRVYFQGRLVWSWVRHLWDEYELLPQPGDRVRVVRNTRCAYPEHRGRIGILQAWGSGEYTLDVGGAHTGPLSDFEVILPEESETNMTDNETVAVSVELIRRVLYNEYQSDEQLAMSEMAALLPKPKPRLVALWAHPEGVEYKGNEPNLLDTLWETIESFMDAESSERVALFDRICAALGVTDD